MNDLLIAVARKELVALLVICNAVLVDRTFLSGFKTAELLKENTIALAVVLAGFILGIAFA
jgi:uncharacterized membrane protein YjfL (UPF0719 family)